MGHSRLVGVALVAAMLVAACGDATSTDDASTDVAADPTTTSPDGDETANHEEPEPGSSTAEPPPTIDPLPAQQGEDPGTFPGCTVLDEDAPIEDASHHSPDDAPPADTLYADQVRPAHSGPHFTGTAPVVDEPTFFAVDAERAIVHNLEHGAFLIAAAPDNPARADIEDWAASAHASGFMVRNAGAGVVLLEWPDFDGSTVGFRAWGQAIDCDTWDRETAAWLLQRWYGSHGIAPEGSFAPYPEGALG